MIFVHGVLPYLLCVFAHVGVDLTEGAHAVELVNVHPGLLCQVRIHVLVTDGWQTVNVGIVPGGTYRERHSLSTSTYSIPQCFPGKLSLIFYILVTFY